MNERIRELVRQAHILAAEQHRVNCLATGKDPSMPHAGALNMTFEKFAELMVKECIVQIDDGNSDHAGGNIDAINRIKEHFGVEE